MLVISTSTYVIAEFVQHSRVDELKNNQTGILMTGDKVAGSRQKYHTDVMDGTQTTMWLDVVVFVIADALFVFLSRNRYGVANCLLVSTGTLR